MDPTWQLLRTDQLSFDRKMAPPDPEAWREGVTFTSTEVKARPEARLPDSTGWPRTVFSERSALILANLDAYYRFSDAWGGAPEERSAGRFQAVHVGPEARGTIDYLTFRRPEVILGAVGSDGPTSTKDVRRGPDLRRVVWIPQEKLVEVISARYGAEADGGEEDRDLRTVPQKMGTAPLDDLLEYWLSEQFPEPIDLAVITEPAYLAGPLAHVRAGGAVVVKVAAEGAVSAANELARHRPRLLVLTRPVLGGLYLVALGLGERGPAVDTRGWVMQRLQQISQEQYPEQVDWSSVLTLWALPEVSTGEKTAFGLEAVVRQRLAELGATTKKEEQKSDRGRGLTVTTHRTT